MGQRRQNQSGFTLGELMMTLTVAGVTLALAIPNFQTITRNNRQATSVNQLVSAMHLARSEAVTRNMQVTLCPSTDGAACGDGWENGWIVFPDRDQDRVVDAGEDILSSATPADSLSLESGEFADSITFRPNGRAMADDFDANSGSFTFCDPRGAEFARVVQIGPTGQPTVPHDTSGLDLECPEGD